MISIRSLLMAGLLVGAVQPVKAADKALDFLRSNKNVVALSVAGTTAAALCIKKHWDNKKAEQAQYEADVKRYVPRCARLINPNPSKETLDWFRAEYWRKYKEWEEKNNMF